MTEGVVLPAYIVTSFFGFSAMVATVLYNDKKIRNRGWMLGFSFPVCAFLWWDVWRKALMLWDSVEMGFFLLAWGISAIPILIFWFELLKPLEPQRKEGGGTPEDSKVPNLE